MKFEWDTAKNISNRNKHGISFEEASEIFSGPHLTRPDLRETSEPRETSFGFLGGVMVVAVVHTDRGGVTRLISARKATKSERKLFYVYLEKTLG